MQKHQKKEKFIKHSVFFKAFFSRLALSKTLGSFQNTVYLSGISTQDQFQLSFYFTRNNIFMILANSGKTVLYSSGGSIGFKGNQKCTLDVSLLLLEKAYKFLLKTSSFSFVSMKLVGACSWKRFFFRRFFFLFRYRSRSISSFSGIAQEFPVPSFPYLFYQENLKLAFNGCRKRKPRRI